MRAFRSSCVAGAVMIALVGSVRLAAQAQAPPRAAESVDTLPSGSHADDAEPSAAAGQKAGPKLAVAAAPAAPAPLADVSVRTSLDRTAMWVADRITYTIEVRCKKNFDILTDDLARDKLKVTGMEVVGGDTVRRVDGDETLYAISYVLTTYKLDAGTLTIAPISARYFVKRAGQRPEEAQPVGAVQVPGAAIALRSLLPDDQATYDIRQRRDVTARAPIYALMMPVGVGLMLLSAAPVLLLLVALGRRLYARRATTTAPSARQARNAVKSRLEAVREADPATAEARRDAFDQLDAIVRQHVHDVSHVPAPSLTPGEIVDALETRASRLPVDLVRRVLATCEIARYAPPDRLPPVDAWRDTLAEAEQVLAAR